MSAEEQEISLVMQGDDLPPLELWHGREQCLEEASNGVPEPRDEAIQD